MLMTCLVVGCTYTGTSGFHRLPFNNKEHLALWIKISGRDINFKAKNHHRICNRHFHAGAFDKKGHLLKGNCSGIILSYVTCHFVHFLTKFCYKNL